MDQGWTGKHDRDPLLLAHSFEHRLCRAQRGTVAVTYSERADERVGLPPKYALGTPCCAAGEQHIEVIRRRLLDRERVAPGEHDVVVPTSTSHESSSGGVGE